MPRLLRSISSRLGFLALAVMFTLLLTPGARAQAGWEVVKIGDREYVTVDSIKTFYQFAKLTRTGDSIKLENPRVEMQFDTVLVNEPSIQDLELAIVCPWCPNQSSHVV